MSNQANFSTTTTTTNNNNNNNNNNDLPPFPHTPFLRALTTPSDLSEPSSFPPLPPQPVQPPELYSTMLPPPGPRQVALFIVAPSHDPTFRAALLTLPTLAPHMSAYLKDWLCPATPSAVVFVPFAASREEGRVGVFSAANEGGIGKGVGEWFSVGFPRRGDEEEDVERGLMGKWLEGGVERGVLRRVQIREEKMGRLEELRAGFEGVVEMGWMAHGDEVWPFMKGIDGVVGETLAEEGVGA